MSRQLRPLSSRLWVVSLTEDLARRVEKAILGWPPFHRNHLGDQWIRAVDSIGLNISEGYARVHIGERQHFFSYVFGFIEEVIYCVRRARDRSLISRLDAWRYAELLKKLAIGIQNLSAAD